MKKRVLISFTFVVVIILILVFFLNYICLFDYLFISS